MDINLAANPSNTALKATARGLHVLLAAPLSFRWHAVLCQCDLKIGQCAKLPPRASFTAQIVGTLLGAVLIYEWEILLSVQGTNIWSGQQPQQYNSQAIAWGGLGNELFSAGMRYQWVPLSYLVGLAAPVPFWLIRHHWPWLRTDDLYTPITCGYIGGLGLGISALPLLYFAIASVSQW